MTLDELIEAWNNQADEYNQWDELDCDERVEFALSQLMPEQSIKDNNEANS